jgi:phenylacetate-coenzyme A ligase PaaK-like adenylate-forming protein
MNRTHYIFGHKVESDEISNDDALLNFSEGFLQSLLLKFTKVPIDSILAVIEKTGQILADPSKIYYQQCMSELPAILNYTPKMVEKGMSLIPLLLNRNTMLERLSHLGNHHLLDYPVYDGNGRLRRAIPAGVVCHIAAGNTFIGAIDSLLYGIVTKNINILKMSSNDRLFPMMFMEALKEADEEKIVFPFIATTYWKHSNEQVFDTIRNISDVVLLFGGEEAVKSFKKDVNPKCEVLAFGPKVSFGVVTAEQSIDELAAAAKGFATDIVFWEQRACTACQNIFLEKSENSELFINMLFNELEKTGLEYPQEPVGTDAAVEIRKQRDLALWEQYMANGKVMEGTTSNHTIIVTNSNNLSDSPLERTVIVNLIDNWSSIFEGSISHLRYYMSTVAIVSHKKQEIINRFIELGVMRFCSPGLMSSSTSASNSHDGKFIVESLIKFINFEDLNDQSIGIDFIEPSEKSAIILSRINVAMAKALQTPFYKEKYKNVKFPLKSIQEFNTLCPLEKGEMAEVSAHQSDQAFSGEASSCYIFSAGGTTGLKKFVLYSHDEFSKSKELFGKGFRALGLNKSNVVANIFPSGAFYTAFLAINKGLEETGCRILSVTGNLSHQETLDYFKLFKPDTIFGLPSLIIPMAQFAEQNGYDLTIKNIIYAAEHLTVGAKTYLCKVFNATKVSSFGYAAVETGPIGYQCSCCKDNEFHVEEEWVYLESDENNDALVTCLEKVLQPVIRYKVGDIIEFVNEPCCCGRLNPKFKLLGRSGEKVRISGYSEIYFEDIEKTVQSTVNDGFIMQLSLDPDGIYTSVKLEVETQRHNDNELNKLLTKNLYDKIPSLNQSKEKNMISKFEVRLVEPASLPRIVRSGKVRRIIDNRV